MYAYFPFYHPFPMFPACIFLAACGHHLIHTANLRTSPSSIVKWFELPSGKLLMVI